MSNSIMFVKGVGTISIRNGELFFESEAEGIFEQMVCLAEASSGIPDEEVGLNAQVKEQMAELTRLYDVAYARHEWLNKAFSYVH